MEGWTIPKGCEEASGRCQDKSMTKQPVTGSLTLPTLPYPYELALGTAPACSQHASQPIQAELTSSDHVHMHRFS